MPWHGKMQCDCNKVETRGKKLHVCHQRQGKVVMQGVPQCSYLPLTVVSSKSSKQKQTGHQNHMARSNLCPTGARARLSCRGVSATAVLLVAVLESLLTLNAACRCMTDK